LVVLLVIALLAVSGCIGGGGSATPTPAPTAGPGASTGPTGSPGASSLTASSIFDTSNLNFYEWRISATGEDPVNFRIEKGTESYKGTPTKFKKMTITEQGEDPDIMTVYYDAAGNAIGAISDGQELPAEVVPSMTGMFNAMDIGQIWGAANYPLSNSLPETLNINGKTYVCQKWAVGNFAGNAGVWTATVNGVQMAVQIQYGDNQGHTSTYQLWDWG